MTNMQTNANPLRTTPRFAAPATRNRLPDPPHTTLAPSREGDDFRSPTVLPRHKRFSKIYGHHIAASFLSLQPPAPQRFSHHPILGQSEHFGRKSGGKRRNSEEIRGCLGVFEGCFVLILLLLAPVARATDYAGGPKFAVSTANATISFCVADDGHVYQYGFGKIDKKLEIPKKMTRQDEFHPQYGSGYISEPAIQVTHADGNTSSDLVYVKHETFDVEPNISLTRIEIKDKAYPLYLNLILKTYHKQDVIEQWAEIHHEEPGPVTLYRYHSGAMQIRGKEYHLSQFHGDYKKEATISEEKLAPGIKIFDSKIGVRAHRFRIPSVMISVDAPAREEEGEVIGASLCWSGSFQIEAEVDFQNRLRVMGGINPVGSQYHLKAKQEFKTPAMLWTWSDQGKGQVSRNFHNWARKYGIRDGNKPRPVLLNNWEATHMDFDEQKIVSLFDGAKDLGVELFLLDDGWFGNKHPRDNDKAGLGDWQVNKRKLPRGLSYLATEAKSRGLDFGIWIEPEMVNPQSDLYEQHPDWAIVQPKRKVELSRNQLVLDLSRPEVREHAWKSIAEPLATPGVSYTKWDANRYVTQPGSSYLGPGEQSHVLVDYNFALYELMDKMAKSYPSVMAMVCSGGGGRVDYGSLRYFHSFWPSDNTDPLSRIKIQWGFGHFFPANTISAHVTKMGNRPPKFACDVALSGSFGVDRDVSKMSPTEHETIKRAVKLYKETLRDIVLNGNLYRLESPYERPRAALSYVADDRSRAALFIYQIKDDANPAPVKPRGLDPKRTYRVRELNVSKDEQAAPQTFDGQTLMRDGITPPCRKELDSAIYEIVAE
jgi:alpha-galactosidase